MPHVVVLGGSFAGCHAIKTLYGLSDSIEVTLVSPSTHAYFNCAAPRVLVEPEVLEKTFFSLEDFIQKVSKGKGKYVQATATNVDFDKNEVTIKVSGSPQVVQYDYLVIATGSKSHDEGFKVNTSHEEAKKGILEWGNKIKESKSIAILGGGPTGVESAGEIAHDLKKKVVLYTGDSAPLAPWNLGEGATKKLEKLGVEVINKVRYTKIAKTGSGFHVVFDDGSEKDFDLVLNTTLYTPYSDFLPDSVKNKAGYVVTDDQLIVQGQKNVFALGDILAIGARSIVDLKMGQLPVFAATAKTHIVGQQGAAKKFAPVTSTILVPISRKGGEGRLFGWSLPNFLVWFLKSRNFMVDQASDSFT
ncbi:hypothetical protein FDK38_002124 [Candidozyma auris]|nr:hypothetical protein FDK38_002124 [[Candida] auris]